MVEPIHPIQIPSVIYGIGMCAVLYNFTTCHFVQPPNPYYVTIRPSCHHFIATITPSQPLTINNLIPNSIIMLFHEYYLFFHSALH